MTTSTPTSISRGAETTTEANTDSSNSNTISNLPARPCSHPYSTRTAVAVAVAAPTRSTATQKTTGSSATPTSTPTTTSTTTTAAANTTSTTATSSAAFTSTGTVTATPVSVTTAAMRMMTSLPVPTTATWTDTANASRILTGNTTTATPTPTTASPTTTTLITCGRRYPRVGSAYQVACVPALFVSSSSTTTGTTPPPPTPSSSSRTTSSPKKSPKRSFKSPSTTNPPDAPWSSPMQCPRTPQGQDQGHCRPAPTLLCVSSSSLSSSILEMAVLSSSLSKSPRSRPQRQRQRRPHENENEDRYYPSPLPDPFETTTTMEKRGGGCVDVVKQHENNNKRTRQRRLLNHNDEDEDTDPILMAAIIQEEEEPHHHHHHHPHDAAATEFKATAAEEEEEEAFVQYMAPLFHYYNVDDEVERVDEREQEEIEQVDDDEKEEIQESSSPRSFKPPRPLLHDNEEIAAAAAAETTATTAAEPTPTTRVTATTTQASSISSTTTTRTTVTRALGRQLRWMQSQEEQSLQPQAAPPSSLCTTSMAAPRPAASAPVAEEKKKKKDKKKKDAARTTARMIDVHEEHAEEDEEEENHEEEDEDDPDENHRDARSPPVVQRWVRQVVAWHASQLLLHPHPHLSKPQPPQPPQPVPTTLSDVGMAAAAPIRRRRRHRGAGRPPAAAPPFSSTTFSSAVLLQEEEQVAETTQTRRIRHAPRRPSCVVHPSHHHSHSRNKQQQQPPPPPKNEIHMHNKTKTKKNKCDHHHYDDTALRMYYARHRNRHPHHLNNHHQPLHQPLHQQQAIQVALVDLAGSRARSARRSRILHNQNQQQKKNDDDDVSDHPLKDSNGNGGNGIGMESLSTTATTTTATATGMTPSSSTTTTTVPGANSLPSLRRSWREIWTANATPVVYGDYRQCKRAKYYPQQPQQYSPQHSLVAPLMISVTRNEWQALLALGQSLLDTLSTTPLSQLAGFCTLMSQLYLSDDNNDNDTSNNTTADPSLLWRKDATMTMNHWRMTMEENILLPLMHIIDACRERQAVIMDMIWSNEEDENDHGVQVARLKTHVEHAIASAPCPLDWAAEQRRQIAVVEEWQGRVERAFTMVTDEGGAAAAAVAANHTSSGIVGSRSGDKTETVGLGRGSGFCGGDISVLDGMVHEAKRVFAFRSMSLVSLECKLCKARELAVRIRAILESSTPEPLKVISSMSREVIKLRIMFPEAQRLLECHKHANTWIDRANVAIRSRITLSEINDLLLRAKSLHVDLSEYTEKLDARKRVADAWLEKFAVFVPATITELVDQMTAARLAMEEDYNGLQELATHGSRIPVEVATVKWLQVELDGRNWSRKARSWIPNYEDSKKGRLEDIIEHLAKATALRNRLTNVLSPPDLAQWLLDGETEIRQIVDDAELWLKENKKIIEGDNRKDASRACISVPKLRQIIDQGNAVFVNLGSAATKLARVLSQAEVWYEAHQDVLRRCANGELVEVSELVKAVQSASNDVTIDLEESRSLADLTDKIRLWFEEAEMACGRRKSHRQKKDLTLEKLKLIIQEAADLPVDTEEYRKLLAEELNRSVQWQLAASVSLKHVTTAFDQLRSSITLACGEPSRFSCTLEQSPGNNDTGSVSSHSLHHQLKACQDKEALNVIALVETYVKEAQAMPISTPESIIALEMDAACRWLTKSLQHLENLCDVFDNRSRGAFDRFVAEGSDLVESGDHSTHGEHHSCSVLDRVRESWTCLMNDGIERLSIMLRERDRYVDWSKKVKTAIDEKKLTFEKLGDIVNQSRSFPSSCDTVKKVQVLEMKAREWIERSSGYSESNSNKLLLQEAKILLDEGEQIGVLSNELRVLRNTVKTASNWAYRVKRCKPESGLTNKKTVLKLLEEHDSFFIEVPDEVQKLKEVFKKYCICRRQFDGFMIACDSCGDWFHGPCIGVTESKAGKVDKYVCIRCSVIKIYEHSASTLAMVVKKWTSVSDCRKARQIEAQKHQRKYRKVVKETDNLRECRKTTLEEIQNAREQARAASSSESTTHNLSQSAGTLSNEHHANDTVSAPPLSISMPLDTPTVDLSLESNAVMDKPPSLEELELRLITIEKTLDEYEMRLSSLTETDASRRNEEEMEDSNADLLRRFAVVTRTLVLAPETKIIADAARPRTDGSLSTPMQNIVEETNALGLLRFQDIQDAINAFKCLCWSLRATSVLSKRPNYDDIQSLVRQASEVKLPDEKSLRMLRVLSQRATGWRNRYCKVLAPCPGESAPYDVNVLRELARTCKDIPLYIPYGSRLSSIIEDNGSRHCFCGGPSDGRFMLSCDSCQRWFHGHCVGVTKDSSELVEEWKCPICLRVPVDLSHLEIDAFHDKFDSLDVMTEDDDDFVFDQATFEVEKFWPPLGLLQSDKAIEALGPSVCAIPSLQTIRSPPSAMAAAVVVTTSSPPRSRAPAPLSPPVHVHSSKVALLTNHRNHRSPSSRGGVITVAAHQAENKNYHRPLAPLSVPYVYGSKMAPSSVTSSILMTGVTHPCTSAAASLSCATLSTINPHSPSSTLPPIRERPIPSSLQPQQNAHAHAHAPPFPHAHAPPFPHYPPPFPPRYDLLHPTRVVHVPRLLPLPKITTITTTQAALSPLPEPPPPMIRLQQDEPPPPMAVVVQPPPPPQHDDDNVQVQVQDHAAASTTTPPPPIPPSPSPFQQPPSSTTTITTSTTTTPLSSSLLFDSGEAIAEAETEAAAEALQRSLELQPPLQLPMSVDKKKENRDLVAVTSSSSSSSSSFSNPLQPQPQQQPQLQHHPVATSSVMVSEGATTTDSTTTTASTTDTTTTTTSPTSSS